MSESSCFGTLNPPGQIRVGTVGKPLPGVELVLADDGEMLVRAPLVMKGYRGDPQKTHEAIDTDGWLHTGDIAQIDGDGYVRIVDRKQEIIINSAGKNMSAANAELSRVEQVKRFAIVDADWLPGGDEFTPTMKLRRKPILQKYASAIEQLYS
jgi:long-subunit acyl-CoA synthetase (AMP-forming)